MSPTQDKGGDGGTQAEYKDMICIGIDPGTHTGVAVWDTREGKFLSLETLMIHDALFYVRRLSEEYRGHIQVVFEDARQRKWFGHGDTDAIIEGLRHAIRAMEDRAAWYERAIKAERESGQEWHMGYESNLARCRKGIALAREEYDKGVQLSLF